MNRFHHFIAAFQSISQPFSQPMTSSFRFLHRQFAHPVVPQRPQVLATRQTAISTLCVGTFLVWSAYAPAAHAQNVANAGSKARVRVAQAQTNKPGADANPADSKKPGDVGEPEGLEVPVGPKDETPNPDPNLPVPEKPATPTNLDTPTPGTDGVSVLNPPVPGGETPPTPGGLRASEAEGLEIADVRVVGNRVVPAQSVLLQATTRRGAAFSTLQVDRDRAKIDALGFFASVQYQVTPNLDDPKKVDLTFIVVENRVVNGFAFQSADPSTPLRVKDEDLITVLETKTGALLNRNTLNADVKRIQDLFKERGYAVLVLDAKQGTDGIVVFNVQQARISRVELAGLSKTKPSIVRKQLRVKSGDIFDQVLLRRDLNRIYDLGFFDDVTYKVEDDPEKPASLILTITLKEKRTGQFTFGLGFDSRSKLTGFVTLAENNLRGTGKRVYGSVEAGAQQTFDVGYGDPFVGKNNASYDINLFSRRVYREPRLVSIVTGTPTTNTVYYQEQRTGGRLNYSVPLDLNRTKKYLLGYRNERASLQQTDLNGNTTPVVSLQDAGRIAAFSAGFLRDRRDLQLDPSRGGREQILVEKAASFFGGNQSFTKIDLDVRRYFPVIGPEKVGELPKLVLANRFVVGQSFGQLPPFEQYFVGGSETVRGYDVDAQLGDNQVYNNLELRYRFQKKLTVVGFIDAGRASGGRFANDDSVLYSIGAGVRLQTPIGPIRFDVGFGRDGARTHFGIGPTF